MSLVHNERTKLTATFLNTVAVATIGASLVVPFFALLYGLGGDAIQIRNFALAAPVWFLIGVGIHLIARAVLGGLKE